MSNCVTNPNLECSKILSKFKNLREYHDVMVKVTNMKAQPDSYKVNYVFGILKKHNLLPDAKKFEEKKDDNISEEARKEGNLFFASNPPKYLDALKAYNKSLCFAISKDNQCLALTNRSAVFFKMEMYKECLESIKLARAIGIPQRLGLEERLKRREVLCREELEKVSPNEFISPKISMPINKKMPFLAKCLEFRENENFGRYVITTKDISVGNIIAIKEPFSKIFPKSQYLNCISCSAEVPHLLMPCGSCTQTMFCSKECKDKAYKDFHAIECPISGCLFNILDGLSQLAFRMTIKAFLAFSDTETLAVALEKMDREQKNVFSYDWSKELSLEDLYTPIRTLKAPKEEVLSVYVEACLAFNLLKHSCPIFSQHYLISTDADNVFTNLMYRHLQLIVTNSFPTDVTAISSNTFDSSDIEISICGFQSLLNHSCAPNVAIFPMGSSYGIAAMRSIAAGEQIFTNYGYTHDDTDKAHRQEELFKFYHFHCKCQACIEDFPMLDEFPMPEDVHAIMQGSDFKAALHLKEFSLDFLRNTFRVIVPFIEKYSHRYPIRQLYDAQKILFSCLYLLCGNITLEMREMIFQARQN